MVLLIMSNTDTPTNKNKQYTCKRYSIYKEGYRHLIL